jgi:hypothetical protein
VAGGPHWWPGTGVEGPGISVEAQGSAWESLVVVQWLGGCGPALKR